MFNGNNFTGVQDKCSDSIRHDEQCVMYLQQHLMELKKEHVHVHNSSLVKQTFLSDMFMFVS